MRKRVYFGQFQGLYWPPTGELASYFIAPKGREWCYDGGNDSYGLEIRGLYGTENLPTIGQAGHARRGTQIEASLGMYGNPDLGVLIQYSKRGGDVYDEYFSIGDLSRLKEWVRTLHDDLRPVGLYIPFRDAWPAVKEFMETDGELPKCIPWIAASDLPENTFPDPNDPGIIAINE